MEVISKLAKCASFEITSMGRQNRYDDETFSFGVFVWFRASRHLR